MPFFVVMAMIFGIFLFWRAGRRELVDSNLLFDTFFVGLIGFLLGGRIYDFIISLFANSFSLKRLIFFNIYGGFSFYGAVLGMTIAVFLLQRRQNIKYLSIFDLIAAPLAFGRSILLLGYAIKIYIDGVRNSDFYLAIVHFFIYFICFWGLKRLEKKKRFAGFFISFYLMFTSVLGIAITLWKHETPIILKNVPVNMLILVIFLILGLVIFYIQGDTRRKINGNVLLALILLGLFKIKRLLTSLPEADGMAKTIVLSPYRLVILLANFVKLTMREVLASLVDLVHAFGIKK